MFNANIPYVFKNQSWEQVPAAQKKSLKSLNITEGGFNSIQQFDVPNMPDITSKRWIELTRQQRANVAKLGMDRRAWDTGVAWCQDARQNPAIWQTFAALEKPVTSHQAKTKLIPQSRYWCGLRTNASKRALLNLAATHRKDFTREAVREIQREVTSASYRYYNEANSSGWTTTVNPQRTPEEIARVAAGGAPIANDASGMSASPVREIIRIKSVEQVQNEVRRAKYFGWQVNAAGSRHSEGAHTCVPGSINLEFNDFNHVELADDGNSVWAGAGATWHDIMEHTRKHAPHKTVWVMQASSVFRVGGSIAVNCHGRTPHDKPLGSTILAMRVVVEDGSEVECSRQQHADLFHSVIGGYGGSGIVVEAKIALADNKPVRMQSLPTSLEEFPQKFADMVNNTKNLLGYGRINPSFFDRSSGAALNFGEEIDEITATGADFEADGPSWTQALMQQAIYRLSTLGEWALNWRWWLEEKVRSQPSEGMLDRYLDLGVDSMAQLPWSEGRHTDLLEEVFIPFDPKATGAEAKERNQRIIAFLDEFRGIQQAHNRVSANITVRFVGADKESKLPYAPVDSMAFVLYYPKALYMQQSPAMDEAFRNALFELTIRHGGRFYLPYQMDYMPHLAHLAYPELKQLLEEQADKDPQHVFASALANHVTNSAWESGAKRVRESVVAGAEAVAAPELRRSKRARIEHR